MRTTWVGVTQTLGGPVGASNTRIHSGYSGVQSASWREICVAHTTEEVWLLRHENPSKLLCH